METATTTTPTDPAAVVWNVPNQLSMLRLALAVGCFVALALAGYWWALGLFAAATFTDWLDGCWARRFNQITRLGR
ncbi:MAG: CDP-alcohol phosphatidyltransferase family protein, partial [Planctomycetota bacterium]